MALALDRVKETSTTTGTGNFTLAGAVTGFRTFNTAAGTNQTFPYFIIHENETEWEGGYGYLSASTTLVRNRVVISTNSNNAVNFTSGSKTVFITGLAQDYRDLGLEMSVRSLMIGF